MYWRPCPRCGQPAPPNAAFCSTCGALLPAVAPPGTFGGPAAPRPQRVPTWLIIVVVAVVAIAVVAALSALVIASIFGTTQHSWGAVIYARPGTRAGATTSFPTPASVQGSWSSVGSGWVNFSLVSAFGGTIFAQNATSGSFSFVSNGFAYTFEVLSNAYENVSVQVTYATHGWSL